MIGNLMILESEAEEDDEEVTPEETPEERDKRRTHEYFEEFCQKKDNKIKVTIRLDKDIYKWYKMGGKGYQTRINAALRAVMEVELDNFGFSSK